MACDKAIIDRLSLAVDTANSQFEKDGAQKYASQATARRVDEFNVEGQEFGLLRTVISESLTVCAIKDKKYGTNSSNKIDEESVKKSVSDCLSSAESSEEDESRDIAPCEGERHFSDGALEYDREKLFFRIKELLSDIKEKHPKIIIEQMTASHSHVVSAYKNSSKTEFSYEGGEYTVELMYSAHEGEVATSFFCDAVILRTLDRPIIELCEIDKNLSRVENQLVTKPVSGKFSGVMILTPSCLADFLSDIYRNFLSDTAILSGSSPWIDKIGQKVADERISISAVPNDARMVAPSRYTIIGDVQSNCKIIENGILKTFVISRYMANKKGLERSSCDFSSIAMEPSDTPLSEIIAKTKRGILVGRYSGGATSSNGDFSGVAKNSFLIEDGKISHALSETMISGNIAKMLSELVGISKESVCDGTSSLPYAAFDNITVSGK
ncbi:MAG: metallopeptidase TldD-related protein [Eubacteriales bacterium]|nr:metallopeptidase TldD-related protein [Eubacteriales bacterium]